LLPSVLKNYYYYFKLFFFFKKLHKLGFACTYQASFLAVGETVAKVKEK
jgi:hypothetical protein